MDVEWTEWEQDTILVRMPEDMSRYDYRGFKMYPGEFAIYVDVLVEELKRRTGWDKGLWGQVLYWLIHLGGPEKSEVNLLRSLQRGEDREDLAREYRATLRHVASYTIRVREFAHYSCPVCRKRYAPKKSKIQYWVVGEGFGDEGGWRFECPRRHSLYFGVDWIM